jgi:hypothetical protein
MKYVRALSIAFGVCALFGCTQTTNLASSRRGDGGADPGDGDGDGDSDGDVPSDAGSDAASPPLDVSDAGVVLCDDGLPCPCNNGRDDDGDRLIDGFDPECTGPFDQDEATFATGEQRGNPNCRDCYFDGNPSATDDDCRIDANCAFDPESTGPGACPSCSPSVLCIDNCLPRTPNGCDCFGCCDVQTADGPVTILLAETCSLAKIDDEDACPRCERSPDCRNECGQCELCPGRTLADLPSECNTGSGPGFVCEGSDVCNAELPCTGFAYCAQGCCAPFL